MSHISRELKDCIDNCTTCHDVCAETIQYCLEKGGKHAEAKHIRLLIDCAEICQTSANYMLRGSDLHPETCRTCAIVCDQCAESCEQMTGDAEMKCCADICRKCADSCHRMESKRAA
ncbi:MAG: four-helix bundle copper-binding protein [Deltaproteobacteria bacterium]|nr:four-helix bundle copper-binding protein [Deltaproteobacteria bacterium]